MFEFNTVKLINGSFSEGSSYPDMNYDFYLGTELELEDQIENIARVSNPSSQDGGHSEAGRLTKYLIKNKHWSPLEMVSVTLEINTTRDIARQILRHRSFHFQEFSQRYADVSELSSLVTKDARSQDTKNRQNSNDDMSQEDKDWWEAIQATHGIEVMRNYEDALKKGVAKEVARSILPEGMTPSRLYMHGTVRDWFHYVKLRISNGTQLEHQDVANKCLVELHALMPNIFSEENIRD